MKYPNDLHAISDIDIDDFVTNINLLNKSIGNGVKLSGVIT